MTMDVRARVVESPNGKLYFLFSRDGLMHGEAVDKIIAALGLQEGDEVGIAFTKIPSSGQVRKPHETYSEAYQSLGRLERAKVRGYQYCCSTRPFYLVPSNNDHVCGILEICLDCGQVQGQWPS